MSAEEKDILINLIKLPAILSGLWKRSLINSYFLGKIFYAYSLFARLVVSIFYISIIAELLRLIINGYKTQIIMSSLSVIANSSKIVFKMIIYMKNNVFELYSDLLEREREIWRKNEPEIIKIYIKKYQVGKLFCVFLISATAGATIAVNVGRIMGTAELIKYNEANNASLESNVNLQFWFPWNKLEHKNWALFLNLLFSIKISTDNITTHIVLITLLVYSAAHLAILQHRLKHYIPDDCNEDTMDKTIAVLKGLILEHQYLIRFTNHINDTCTNTILVEYLLSSFDAASVTLNILKVGWIEMGYFVCFLVLLFLQILGVSWCCNEINIESQAIADAAFKSKWHLLNKDGKQLTLLMIQQAQQRPLMMTIGSFGPMTLSSFLTIWKIAYSYLSIMRK